MRCGAASPAEDPYLKGGTAVAGLTETQSPTATRPLKLALKAGPPLLAFGAVLLAPTPDGLTPEGQRALAVMALAVVLWATEVVPIAVTGLVGVLLLVLLGAVPSMGDGLYGFAQPVTYFLVGILTLGLAVHHSGLAQRMALHITRLAGGSPRMLYLQMLVSFAALTFALPSASTRGAIMVHIYEQVMGHWNIAKDAPLNKAVMLAMGSLNRLASTALLAGGITPVVASSLVGGFSWRSWFVMMAPPFYAMLAIGGALLFLMYRSGFTADREPTGGDLLPGPITFPEKKAGLIALGTALLWFTDFAHGLPPAVPALIAMTVILLPGIGLLTWREFERDLGWSNFFVIASSLSLAHALASSGAAGWFAQMLVGTVAGIVGYPVLLLLALGGASAIVRLMMPNISGYLAFMVPVAMSTGESLGLNPLVCGLAVVVVGDALVYYPAGATASVFIYQRANIGAPEVFRFGVVMTVVAIAVLVLLVLPYWNWLGEGLTV